jgi:hypothetical protein
MAQKLSPGSKVQFDPDADAGIIRFRVTSSMGTILIESSGHYLSSELCDKSDNQLEAIFHTLSNNRM